MTTATTTTHRYEGFLFYHGDSRGGSTFVPAGDPAEATRRYARAFGCDDVSDAERAELLDGLYDQDFVGAATLDSDVALADGTELDGTWDGHPGRVWFVSLRDVPEDERRDDEAEAFIGDLIEGGEVVRLEYRSRGGPRPSPRHVQLRWDDDAFALVFGAGA